MSKIVFFGNEQLAQGLDSSITPIFDELAASDYEISAVILPRRPQVVSRKSHELKIVESAKINDVRVLYADEINLEEELQKLNADIGVLVSYGKIISQKIIDVFPRGIVNIHPSELPKYRGPTPIENTILNGDESAGVSLMSLTSEMDAGPIYAQKSISLRGDEDKNELYLKLSNLGRNMLITNLPNILSGKLKPYNQPDTENSATYTKKILKSDGNLNPTIMIADECERKVRAFLGFPRTHINFLGQDVIVTKAKALNDFDGNNWPDLIKCANDTTLQIIELVSPKSGKKMSANAFVNGIHK